MKKYLFLTAIIFLGSTPFSYAYRLRGVIHVHSIYSNKKLTLDELVVKSKESNLDIVFFTDNALRRIKYGIYPLSNILSYTYEERSVLKIGPEKYLSEINYLRNKYPDMVLIPGVEAGAFYYWTGNYFKSKEMTLHGWHKHMLILGLEKAEDYRKLPLLSNKMAGNYTLKSITLL